MFAYWAGISGAGQNGQVSPGIRIKRFSGKERNKILIAEPRERAVMRHVVSGLFRMRSIHISRVPFVAVCRYAVGTPVKKESKLCVLVPRRAGMDHNFSFSFERFLGCGI